MTRTLINPRNVTAAFVRLSDSGAVQSLSLRLSCGAVLDVSGRAAEEIESHISQDLLVLEESE